MMKLTELQKYKHDTVGKFQTIKSLVEMLDEENLNSEESLEILTVINDSYLNILKSSEQFLQNQKTNR